MKTTIAAIVAVVIASNAFASGPNVIIDDPDVLGPQIKPQWKPCPKHSDKPFDYYWGKSVRDCFNSPDRDDDKPDEKECGKLKAGVQIARNGKDCAKA